VFESEGLVPEQSDANSKTVLFRTNGEGGGVEGGKEGGLTSRSGRKRRE